MLLLGRIRETLDRLQPYDQAGFRSSFGCSDHVHALRQLAEKAAGWGQTEWAASLDLEKAFDKVLHSFVFGSLAGTGVETDVINDCKPYIRSCPHMCSSNQETGANLFLYRVEVGRVTLYRLSS